MKQKPFTEPTDEELVAHLFKAGVRLQSIPQRVGDPIIMTSGSQSLLDILVAMRAAIAGAAS